ncbi:MAG: 50S ribosomal protein L4 [bacterium]
MKVATYTKSGSKATTETTLDAGVFEREVTPQLIKLSYSRTLANRRLGTAKTKTRGEIRGGGKKPHAQKGTGRARSGSSRNPLWRGGGTIFGPTGEQNHTIEMPKKAIRASLAQALTLKAQSKAVVVVESFEIKKGTVKEAQAILGAMKLTGSILILTESCDKLVQRATRNLSGVTATEPRFMTVNDILDSDTLVITKPALELTQAWLGGTK